MRRQFKGNTKPTALATGIAVGATTLTLVDATNYPDGSIGPFVLTLDLGQAGEEKVLATSRTGNTISGLTRGYDGTSAGAHSAGAPAAHTISAVDLDEANAHVNATGDVHSQYLLKSVAPKGRLAGTQVDTPSGNYNAHILTALNVTLVAGRRYAVKGYVTGRHINAAGDMAAGLLVAGVPAAYAVLKAAAVNEYYAGSVDYELVAGSSGVVQMTLRIDTSAGLSQITAGAWKLRVEDIGV